MEYFNTLYVFIEIVEHEFLVFLYCQKKWPESQEAMVNEVLELCLVFSFKETPREHVYHIRK